jgi:serine/threonine-protein kinase
MASIYLARQKGDFGFERRFALKVAGAHATRKKQAMPSLLREARIGGLLKHPNILGVLEVGDDGGQPFLVMEYVEGASLAELLASPRPLPLGVLARILVDALCGLQAAHQQADAKGLALGIVHCDLSPQNIMVGLDGVVRIIDFGSAHLAARADGAQPDLHQGGETQAPGGASVPTVGRPGFMSPEQLAGDAVDARSDVFAMGVVMWTALTGHKLFSDPSYGQTVLNVLRKKIVPPSAHGAPAALDQVCLRALARSAADRYQSAEEMRLHLCQVASRAGLLAENAEIKQWVARAAGDRLAARRLLGSDGADAPPLVTRAVVVRAAGSAAREASTADSHTVDTVEARGIVTSVRQRSRRLTTTAAALAAVALILVLAFVRLPANLLPAFESAGGKTPAALLVEITTALSDGK